MLKRFQYKELNGIQFANKYNKNFFRFQILPYR